jgi:NDP-sugar pyrophosphorylase family protein
MLDIVIPMAGRGSRFASAGFDLPKPLIDVQGKPMVQWVVENLRPSRDHRFVFLCLAEHLDRYDVVERLDAIAPGCEVIAVDQVTEGAACTVLLARELIDGERPLMIANSDQWVDASIDEYLAVADEAETDGLIMTMTADHPKWSFVRPTAAGYVLEVAEKQVISNEATVGVYNFARGSDYVRAAELMIERGLRVNGEFYVAPTYNQLIEEGARIRYHNIGDVEDAMWGLGTPEDLKAFLVSPHAQVVRG